MRVASCLEEGGEERRERLLNESKKMNKEIDKLDRRIGCLDTLIVVECRVSDDCSDIYIVYCRK